ncbi:hypothetical protein MRB53_019842 [Persea americana]|uniref:Uncharacterized protein n=1 Tax=Persea americana TaxID=3435 RepID=A0ACC2KZC6_PERAE|nr:hypothetical protein MRB53_019842 [Persea americana]
MGSFSGEQMRATNIAPGNIIADLLQALMQKQEEQRDDEGWATSSTYRSIERATTGFFQGNKVLKSSSEVLLHVAGTDRGKEQGDFGFYFRLAPHR